MYDKIKANSNKVRLVFLFLLILLGFVVLTLFWGRDTDFAKDLMYEILTGLVFTTLTIFMLSVFNWMIGKKDMDDLHEKQSLSRMLKLMKGKGLEDNLISEVYNEQSARQIMINSIGYFNKRLAEPYASLISEESTVIRENFNYRINIVKEENGLEVEQNLKYKRYFKPYDQGPYKMKCGFTFSTKYLGNSLFDSTFFMREEIHDNVLVKQLIELFDKGQLQDVLSLLFFKSFFYSRNNGMEIPISKNDIEVTPLREEGEIVGFKTEVILPEEIYSTEDGLYSYTARVSFTLPQPKSNRFYCVFANPIIGETHFSIRFPNKATKVDYLEFLTMSGKRSRIHQRNSREWEFETNETIFPTSAIIWFWDDL